jgi:hypothetical protein
MNIRAGPGGPRPLADTREGEEILGAGRHDAFIRRIDGD